MIGAGRILKRPQHPHTSRGTRGFLGAWKFSKKETSFCFKETLAGGQIPWNGGDNVQVNTWSTAESGFTHRGHSVHCQDRILRTNGALEYSHIYVNGSQWQ